MTKNDIYAGITLITILLLSILWKEELEYRRNLISEIESLQTTETSPEIKSLMNNSGEYLGKAKLDPKGWSEKYGEKLIFQNLRSDES